MDRNSVWIDQAGKGPEFAQLTGGYDADVVIVGAGITGLTAGLRLALADKKVIILEAYTIGSGTTGHSSCHLNSSIEKGYSQVTQDFGGETARIVAESRKEGISFIETICHFYNIDADFRRIPGYLYAENEESVPWLIREVEMAKNSGIDAEFVSDTPLKIKTYGAVRFNGEAEFNSQKYLYGLARLITEKGGQVFEHSMVTDILQNEDQFVVKTERGLVRTREVIQATHLPLFVNVLQTMAAPYRSYLITYRIREDFPEGLFYNTDDPYFYLRTTRDESGKILVAGGADHKTGHETDTEKSFETVDRYVRERFPAGEIIQKWSSQLYIPADGLPYIGENPLGIKTYLATGFAGDGLIFGTIAGIILSDQICGIRNPWADVYDSKRFTPISSAKEFIKENIDVASHFIADRFKTAEGFSDIAPGEGKIVNYNGEKIAVSRDNVNELHAISPVCTHMKCFVQWNKGEQTWDCPCHGSRFDPDGKIISGPAVIDLEQKTIQAAGHGIRQEE
jgi:glycine/D-amino acid oxidase-like deaminating enzyme/nitrite reductase/ring-hydroxylating ferredoxin subunit